LFSFLRYVLNIKGKVVILERGEDVAMGAEDTDQVLLYTKTSNAKEKTRSKIASTTRKTKSKQKEEDYW
jgi:hypothetical protein